jgi:lysozyme
VSVTGSITATEEVEGNGIKLSTHTGRFVTFHGRYFGTQKGLPMAGSNVLKEFLVKISFKEDEAGKRRFMEGLGAISKQSVSLTKNFVQLGASFAATGVAAAVGLQKIAKPLESLYFASKRTGATANELEVLQKSFAQIGVSAEQSQGAIESLSGALRNTPGLRNLGAYFGMDPKQTDNAKNLRALLEGATKKDTGGAVTHAALAQQLSMFGISEDLFNQFEQNRAEFNKSFTEQQKLVGKFDVDKMSKTGHSFATAFRNAATNTELLADKVATGVMPAGEKVLADTVKLEDVYSKIDDKTGGWLGHLTVVAGLSKGILTTWQAISALRGLGAATTVAEGAGAVGGAAAGGGTLAALAGLIPDVGAAMIGSHYLKKATKNTWWGDQQEVTAAQGGKGLKDQIAGLAGMVASFEGHAKAGYGLYKDAAGRLTAGFGHLVKPGEDFSKGLDKQGAQALLAKDLQSAGDAVKKLVKVSLTGNQMKALEDFVFNLGAGNLAKSTLLKDINSGNTQAIAADFARFNKIHEGGHLVANEGLTRRRAAEAELFNTPDRKPSVTNNIKTDIHIEAGPDANSTGQKVAQQQMRVNQDLVRNLQPGVS